MGMVCGWGSAGLKPGAPTFRRAADTCPFSPFFRQVPLSQLAYSLSAAPQILCNPAQQVLAYTGFCPPSAPLPTCSSYPLPLQVGSVSPGGSPCAHIVGSGHLGQPWSDET